MKKDDKKGKNKNKKKEKEKQQAVQNMEPLRDNEIYMKEEKVEVQE